MKDRPVGSIIAAFLLTLLSMVLFPIWPFAGYYWYDSYYGTYNYLYLNWGHIVSGPLMGIAMLLFISILVILIISLVSKKVGSSKAPYILTLVLLGIIFLVTIIGAVVVAGFGIFDDNDDWWLGGAFYVSCFGPFLISIFLLISLVLVSKKKNGDINEE